MAMCIDLKQRFGQRYRLSRDPATESRTDPWGYQIRGRRGVIYPFGGDKLAVECDYHPRTAARLAAIGLELVQDGDGEKTFVFDVSRFEAVAAIIQPYKRRQLSPEHKARLMESNRAFCFRRFPDALEGSRMSAEAGH